MKRTLMPLTVLALSALALPLRFPPAATVATEHALADHEAPTWSNGLPSDPSFFPIGVWLQQPSNAPAFQDVGINVFVGLWQGPTAGQLDELEAVGMPVFGDQNDTALARLDNPTMVGYLQQDEPDNAQPDGSGGYGPCVDPTVIVDRYRAMHERDPSRPVLLNLGQGVAHDLDRPYVGRGSACSRRWDQYPEYVQGADIVSFDIYPVTSPYDHIQGDLWRVALGIDRLREWTGGTKPVWAVIETTHISADVMPTPHDVRAEVWMALVHGASGLFYFSHEWQPTFRETGLLYYPEMREAVAELNREIIDLAPVLNSPTLAGAVRVETANAAVPVDVLVKQLGDWTYVFAVAMRDAPTEATMAMDLGFSAATTVEVIGEERSVPLVAGAFRDDFEGYDVHLYRVRTQSPLALPWMVR